MPITLSSIREKFPMYDKVSDEQLIIGLHKKYYSDIPFKQFNENIVYDNAPDPTEGMSNFDKAAAGYTKSFSDTLQGLGQMVGAVDRADVAETRKLDAPLMKSGAARAGNFAGEMVQAVPLAAVPGANTVKGASLIGAAYGLTRPSESTKETLKNTGMGGALGGGSILAGRGVGAAYQGGTGLLRPTTQKGQRQIAAEILQASATDPAAAAARLSKASPLLPGSVPTAGQASGDAGLAQLERTLTNNPETAQILTQRYAQQQAARTKAIASVAGTPDYRDAIKEGRRIFANEDYAEAFAKGFDADAFKALEPQIKDLLKRPSLKSAQITAKSLAAESGQKLSDFGSVQGLHWLKEGLDSQINAAKKVGSTVSDAKVRAMVATKQELMSALEKVAPGYKLANDNYAAMSRNINSMDVAADLQSRLYKNAQYGSGKEMGDAYKTELGKATESVRGATGMDRPLGNVMNTKDIATLEAIALDLSRKEALQNSGRAAGSNTMQNMMGQNLVNRIAGPLGMPKSFSEGVLANTLARPYDFMARAAQPRISATLAEALADPVKAQELLLLANQPSRAGLLASKTQRFLPSIGLLAAP